MMSVYENYDRKEANPFKWVTREKFLEFMTARGVSMICECCGQDGRAWWIDTGWDDGYVPRIASMPTLPSGKAATSDTYQMPVVRAVCGNCGNIRLHWLGAMKFWRDHPDVKVDTVADAAPDPK